MRDRSLFNGLPASPPHAVKALAAIVIALPLKWGYMMAYAAPATSPLLIASLLFQKWSVQSVSSSGVKE